MPPVITSIGAFKQSLTGGAFEALAAATKDSLSIISFPDSEQAWVEEVFANNSAHKMELAIFSQRFGDNTYGLRTEVQYRSGTTQQAVFPRSVDVPVWSADTLNVQVNGTASDNANAVLQLYYTNIQGAGQRLARAEQVIPLVRQGVAGNSRLLGIEVTVTPGTTGNYGTAVALNTNDDRLQADYDYALIGFASDQPVLSIGISGPDTGYYRVPMPALWQSRFTADWFLRQAADRGVPHIPVINANNKAVTFLDGIDAGNPGATKVTLYLAQFPTRFTG
jgi:hypothetical protein